MGKVFGLYFGLTGSLALPSQPAQLIVGVILPFFRFGVRFNPVVTIDISFFSSGLNGMGKAIALALQGLKVGEIGGKPLQFRELIEIKHQGCSQTYRCWGIEELTGFD